MQSLSGHQGAVEAVAFDPSEEAVAAGSAGGSVKLWDVEQERGECSLCQLG